ncbi:MAG: hypothetical protein NC204_02160 [Candidatus Amulumruptor caecigallinarius]|nr:hypothetical protein [Candidatus Amulumruptor caecigallinarius]
MKIDLHQYKSLVLPFALVAGYFCRQLCATVAFTVPYAIFLILILTFSSVKLRSLRPSRLDFIVALFQAVVSAAIYVGIYFTTSNIVLAQGAMMCVLCPVASSVTVVSVMLGAKRERTVSYTIVGNLVVSVLAPLYFTLIDEAGNIDFLQTFLQILLKISSAIALPVFAIYLLQQFAPKVNAYIARYQGLSFYLWAYALFVTIGQTADFVVERWASDSHNIARLLGISFALCMLQFAVGKKAGACCGDKIAGGQIMAQKNSAIGIWMLNTFLNPIASVALAGYSIAQNLFNSWQLYRNSRKR